MPRPSKDAEVAAPDCLGAVRDRKIGHAAAKLAQLGQGHVAMSLDHANCFDQLHPRLALDELRMRGWPEGVLSLAGTPGVIPDLYSLLSYPFRSNSNDTTHFITNNLFSDVNSCPPPPPCNIQ